jgi:hypothetical protein
MNSDLLYSLNSKLSSENAILNNDFLTLFWYCKLKYARNFFRYKSEFKNKKYIKTRMNYDYADDNNTPDKFLAIQKKINTYRLHIRQDNWYEEIEKEYIDFLNESIKIIVDEIVVPIFDIPERYQEIIEKYKKKYLNYRKKSSKINYDSLRKLLGDDFVDNFYDE